MSLTSFYSVNGNQKHNQVYLIYEKNHTGNVQKNVKNIPCKCL